MLVLECASKIAKFFAVLPLFSFPSIYGAGVVPHQTRRFESIFLITCSSPASRLDISVVSRTRDEYAALATILPDDVDAVPQG